MKLSVVLRIDVRDQAEGQRFFRVIKDQYADNPEISVTGNIITDADEVEPADPG